VLLLAVANNCVQRITFDDSGVVSKPKVLKAQFYHKDGSSLPMVLALIMKRKSMVLSNNTIFRRRGVVPTGVSPSLLLLSSYSTRKLFSTRPPLSPSMATVLNQ